MPIQTVRNRWTKATLFELEAESLKEAVTQAIASGANLTGANLRGANLRGADLRGADLRGADLIEADLRGANLREANLRGADLRGADLIEADLRGANLRGANLRGANLRGADLRGADLRGADLIEADLRGANLREANLRGANLSEANLRSIREDFLAVLSAAPAEVSGLRLALVEGRIHGSTYEGECCCLVGTLAKVRGCDYDALDLIPPNASRPAERWFLAIRRGDTPESSQVAAITLQWIDEWVAAQAAAVAN